MPQMNRNHRWLRVRVGRTRIASLIGIAGLALLGVIVPRHAAPLVAQDTEPTFTQDVAPILYKNCTTCHHPGGLGPFTLMDYDSVKKRVDAIEDAVKAGIMPPWHAEGPAGMFRNDRRLSDRDKGTILRWIDAGAKPGDMRAMPARPSYPTGWEMGAPDAIVSGIPFSLLDPEVKRGLLRATYEALAPAYHAAFIIYQVTNELKEKGHCDHFSRVESEYCLQNIPPMFVTKFYRTLNGREHHGMKARPAIGGAWLRRARGVLAPHPDSAEFGNLLLREAEVAHGSGELDDAKQLAQDALRMDPNFKDAMVTIARDHYRARKMDLAKYALQAVLEGFGDATPARDKENAEAHLLRGLIMRESGSRIVALKDFEAASAKRPDLVEALVNLGSMRLEAGNANEALAPLESATRFAPNLALAHLNLGDNYRLLQRYADAKTEFDKALALDSSLAAAHYDLGLMYLTAQSIPGTSADQQVSTAIKEFETYKTMRGAKAPPGVNDEIDDLLGRAKAKQAELKNTVAPAAGAAPAGAKPAAAKSDGGGIVRDMQ